MASFTAGTRAEAVVLAPREAIWDVLTDPTLVARLTPLLERITAEGDHWTWQMTGIDVLGVKVAPSFTERMSYRELERIGFSHDPPAGAAERAGVEGWYQLDEVPDADGGGTRLATSLDITLELPLPKVSSPAVTAAMKGVVGQMGERFSKNLLAHLGVEER
ncbi:CoxG family protein [Nocardioides sp. SYSU DS0663]|uniref:CoxG family protein n=1 Tax=Nocardioides sp. SYSU DS0663 TaxID=3416445 RepID=UPI003F4BE014